MATIMSSVLQNTLPLTMALGFGLLLLMGPSLNLALFLMFLLLLGLVFFLVIKSKTHLAPLFVFVPALALDAPWGRPFNDVAQPLTEILGDVFFSAAHKSLGLPGVSFSLFEILTFVLTFILWLKYKKSDLSVSSARLFWLVTLLVPLGICFSIITGIFRGHDVGLILTQSRSLLTLPFWMMIGYAVFSGHERVALFMNILTVIVVAKVLQALWIFSRQYSFNLGSYEFLVEHITSDLIVTALIWSVFLCLMAKNKIMACLSFLAVMIPSAYIYIINDRRASFAGCGLFSLIIPFLCPKKYRFLCALTFSGLVVLSSTYVALTWGMSGPLGFPARTIQSLFDNKEDTSNLYRVAENKNFAYVIRDNPALGLGLGTRLPIVEKMADISSIYENYDLLPHNTLMFLWAFGGPITFSLFSLFIIFLIAAPTQSCINAHHWVDFSLPFILISMITRWLVYVMTDIGLTEVRFLMIIGLVAGGYLRQYKREAAYLGIS